MATASKNLPYSAGKIGTGLEGVHHFATLSEAEDYIAEIEKMDPQGVYRGDYFVDAPGED